MTHCIAVNIWQLIHTKYERVGIMKKRYANQTNRCSILTMRYINANTHTLRIYCRLISRFKTEFRIHRLCVFDLVGDFVDGIAKVAGQFVQLRVLLHLEDAKVDGDGGDGNCNDDNECHRNENAERAAATAAKQNGFVSDYYE